MCIDQKVAFIGGLDLAFGRYDTAEHTLLEPPGKPTMFPGKDYNNPRIKDFADAEKPDVDLMERTLPRMPW